MEQPFRIFNNPLFDVLDSDYEKINKWKNIPYNENKNQYNNRQCNNHNSERRISSGGIIGNSNNSNRTNNVSNNRVNNGNSGNYGNNGNRNNGNGNNNNQNGGGGNKGNNDNNRGNGNYQNNNYGCRPPMTIERYKQLDFSGIVVYLNQISNDLRSAIPKFTGNGTDSIEQHVINVKNTIEEFEVAYEVVFMKLFVQSLTKDVGEWYKNLPDSAFDSKTHYEILSHKPTTLQQAFKTSTTIENNRKAIGIIGKRDDPKLYNPRATKKDKFSQIMDMLKVMNGKQNHNEKPPHIEATSQ
ncbi:uncharacterized protein LOC131860239 [Cryptomeria japonica]|uniref:uncharacterized protein LOC131860239 n=1 Tax=Cryptomeria japonica TaxID=3369 RepID=UPI0027DAAAF6|nr:uncharacterized protein LOC131860239 [Cryptomeria japonica]